MMPTEGGHGGPPLQYVRQDSTPGITADAEKNKMFRDVL